MLDGFQKDLGSEKMRAAAGFDDHIVVLGVIRSMLSSRLFGELVARVSCELEASGVQVPSVARHLPKM